MVAVGRPRTKKWGEERENGQAPVFAFTLAIRGARVRPPLHTHTTPVRVSTPPTRPACSGTHRTQAANTMSWLLNVAAQVGQGGRL